MIIRINLPTTNDRSQTHVIKRTAGEIYIKVRFFGSHGHPFTIAAVKAETVKEFQSDRTRASDVKTVLVSGNRGKLSLS